MLVFISLKLNKRSKTYKLFLLPLSHSLQKFAVIQRGWAFTLRSFLIDFDILSKIDDCFEGDSISFARFLGGGDIWTTSSMQFLSFLT